MEKNIKKRRIVNYRDCIREIVSMYDLYISKEALKYLNNVFNIVVRKFIKYKVCNTKFDSKEFFRVLVKIFQEDESVVENTTLLSRYAYTEASYNVDDSDRYNLIVLPSVTKRQFGKIKCSKKIIYFVSGVLQYLLKDILNMIVERGTVTDTIYVDDIKDVIKEDDDFRELFDKNRIKY